jgi:hypothetical protein
MEGRGMRKHLVLAVLLAVLGALFLGGEAKASHPCLNFGYGCLHWPDGNRGNRTQVRVDRAPNATLFNAAWTGSFGYAMNEWNAAQSKVTLSYTTTYYSVSNCNVVAANYRIVACADNIVGVTCGGLPPDRWLGCTAVWYWMEWNGSAWVPSNHIYGARIMFDTFTNYTDSNQVVPWNGYQRNGSACHELGHALGQDHYWNGGTVFNPGHDSCLRAILEDWVTSTYPGTHVAGSVSSAHNHNDGAYGDLSYGDRTFNRKARVLATSTLEKRLESAKPILEGENRGKRAVVLGEWESMIGLPAPVGRWADVVFVKQSAGVA